MEDDLQYQNDVRTYALNKMGIPQEKIDRMRFTDLDLLVHKHVTENHSMETLAYQHHNTLASNELKIIEQSHNTNEFLSNILNDDTLGIASFEEANQKYKVEIALNSDIEKMCLNDNELGMKLLSDQIKTIFDIVVSLKDTIIKDEEVFKINNYLTEQERNELKHIHIHQKRMIKYLYKLLLYISQSLNVLYEKRTRLDNTIVINPETKAIRQSMKVKTTKISALNILVALKLQELKK
jgi:hypothetical protein